MLWSEVATTAAGMIPVLDGKTGKVCRWIAAPAKQWDGIDEKAKEESLAIYKRAACSYGKIRK